MEKNMLNEVNTIREQMGLSPLNENELLHLELSKIDLDPMNEGAWENVKYALSKLGRYKAGGKIFGKTQTDAKTAAKITAILDKQGNEVIKNLDRTIKEKNPEFPNNKSQLDFLNILIEIATVYDSLVAATKLNPNDKGYLPVDAANTIIEDLRAYTQKYLDVDLTAAFSVFNEEEEMVDEDVIDEASSPAQQAAIAINMKKRGVEPKNESESLDESELEEANPDVTAAKSKFKGKVADTKAAIKKGDIQAYGSERMKTLDSNKLPLLLSLGGGILKGLSWMFQTEWFKNLVDPETIRKITTPQEVTNLIDGGQPDSKGMLHWMSKISGKEMRTGADVTNFIKQYGGEKAVAGMFINNGAKDAAGHLLTPEQQAQMLSQLCGSNPSTPVGELFSKAAKTFGSMKPGLHLFGISSQAAFLGKSIYTTYKTTETAARTGAYAKWGIAAKILGPLGLALGAGALAVKLARYKGKKSSRAQLLNDLIQYLRPVEGSAENPPVIDNEQGGGTEGGGNEQGGGNKKQGANRDTELYNQLKKYFKDIYNFKSQVNTDTYGKVGSSNQTKYYSGSGEPTNNVATPQDASDLMKLLESFQMLPEETLKDLDLSSNQLRLINTNIEKLAQIKKTIDQLTTDDKNLAKLIDAAKANVVFKTDINSLLQSDAKSLKIFVSNFNKAIYSTTFKNGNTIVDQLNKIQINKLNEKAERTEPKGSMNKIYNDRREFLVNIPGYITTLYSIFSYLIDKLKSKPEGNKPEQADYLTGQKAGKQSPGLTSTGKAQVNKGLNAANAEKSLKDFGKTLEEGGRISKSSLISLLEARAAKPAAEPKEEMVDKNGRHYKILKSFATILPEIQNRVAKSFNEQFPNEPNISSVKLGKVLEMTLNALAEVPESRMRMFITNAGADIALYNMVLGKVNEATKPGTTQQDAIKNGVNYKIMMALSAVVPEFKNKIANLYNKSSNDTLAPNRIVGFLQVVLSAAAVMPSERLKMYITNSGGDSAIYKALLSKLRDIEDTSAKPEGLNFDVDSFLPETVANYDLSGTKQSFRIALSQKAAEIISRHNDMKIDEKNMLNVMKQLIDLINNKYLDKANPKRIPTVGE